LYVSKKRGVVMEMIVVDVYGGYGGMGSIYGVEEIRIDGGELMDGVNKVRCRNLDGLMIRRVGEGEVWDDEKDMMVFKEFGEFYSSWSKYGDNEYGVSNGEESFWMIVGEDSVWFERLKGGDSKVSESWDEKVWSEWMELCGKGWEGDNVGGGWLYDSRNCSCKLGM
jgi:hypothetical protein